MGMIIATLPMFAMIGSVRLLMIWVTESKISFFIKL